MPPHPAMPPLMRWASLNGVTGSIRRQLARGVGVDARDDLGRTGLMLAAMRGHLHACAVLLAAGADPALRDPGGRDAEAIATAWNHGGAAAWLAARVHELHRVDETVGPLDPGRAAGHLPAAPIGDPDPGEPPAPSPSLIDPDLASGRPARVRRRRRRRTPPVLTPRTRRAWHEVIEIGSRNGAVSEALLRQLCPELGLDLDEEAVESLVTDALAEVDIGVEAWDPWVAARAEEPAGDRPDPMIAPTADDVLDVIRDLVQAPSRVGSAHVRSLGRVVFLDVWTVAQTMEEGQSLVLEAIAASERYQRLLRSDQADGAETGSSELLLAALDDPSSWSGPSVMPPMTSSARIAASRLADAVEGDPAARDLICGARAWNEAWKGQVLGWLRFVVYVVRKGPTMGVPLDDLVQEGNLGLMRAVDKFDLRRPGNPFASYLSWWIRSMTQRYRVRSPIVHVTTGHAEIRRRVAAWTRWAEARGRSPSLQEIADHTGLGRGQVVSALAPDFAFAEPGSDLVDEQLCSPEDVIATLLQVERLERSLAALALRRPRVAHVLRMRFGLLNGDEASLEATGAELGISRQRVAQLERVGMEWLKRRFGMWKKRPTKERGTAHLTEPGTAEPDLPEAPDDSRSDPIPAHVG